MPVTMTTGSGATTRTVAITGGGGFLGRHLTTVLRAQGFTVIAVVRPGASTGDADGRIDHDLDAVGSLATALRDANVDVVCHLAWDGHPRSAGLDYTAQLDRNVVPSANLAVAAGLAGVGHVVFVSSGGAVAVPREGPRPAYGWAKLAVEAILEITSRDFGYALTVMRPTALMGPGQDPSRGLGVVTIFARQALLGEPVRIIGSVDASRDFLHVVDLSDCIAAVVDRRAAGVFEVGGPEVIRLGALVALLEGAVGRPIAVELVPGSGVDPEAVRMDNGAITGAVGWTPGRTLEASLPEILADVDARQRAGLPE